jgi:hypothetical protein
VTRCLRRSLRRSLRLLPILLVLLLPHTTDAQKTSRRTRVRGTRVTLVKPNLFVQAPYGMAFLFPNGGAQIQVSEFPRPLASMQAGFASAARSTPGVELEMEEGLEVNGHHGVFMVVKPTDPSGFTQWALLLGDEKECALIVGTGPENQHDTFDRIYRRVLLSAEWDRGARVNPYDALPFILTGKSLFDFATRYQSNLTFTLGGKTERESPDDPLLVVSVIDGRVDESQHEEFCKQSLLQTAAMKDVAVVASGLFESDGMKGCEAIGEARAVTDERSMMIYDATLFEKSRRYSFKGIAGVRFRAQYVAEFARMTRQLRRK